MSSEREQFVERILAKSVLFANGKRQCVEDNHDRLKAALHRSNNYFDARREFMPVFKAGAEAVEYVVRPGPLVSGYVEGVRVMVGGEWFPFKSWRSLLLPGRQPPKSDPADHWWDVGDDAGDDQ